MATATQTTIAPVDKRAATIRDLLTKSKTQISAALPKQLNADRMLRVAMTSVQRTPKLLECDPITLVGAVIQCAQLGLEPDGVLGHAYLVPFWNTKKNRFEVQFIPGYKGLIDLARRSGQISTILAKVVYENDQFDVAFGLEPKLVHVPSRDADPGQPVAAYAVARLRDGGAQFELLWYSEIEKIRNTSKSGDRGPWKDHWDEMAKKSALRRLCKLLPTSVELQRAVAHDELAESGIPQDLGSLVPIDLSHRQEVSLEDLDAEDQEREIETTSRPKPARTETGDALDDPQRVDESEPAADTAPKSKRTKTSEKPAPKVDEKPVDKSDSSKPAEGTPRASRALTKEAITAMVKGCESVDELGKVYKSIKSKVDSSQYQWLDELCAEKQGSLEYEASQNQE